MKFFRVLPLLCVLGGFVLPGFALDREAFTFTRYDLNVRVEPEQQRLGVRGKITLRNDSGAPQRNAVLQISSSLNWSSIRMDGQPVEFLTQVFTSDIDHTGALSEAIVTFPRAIDPNQTIELELGYEGIIPQDATRLTRIGVPENTAKHSDWDQIARPFTVVRGIGNVAWYPIATESANLSEPRSVSVEVGRWKKRETQTRFDVDLCPTSSESQPAAQNLMNEPRSFAAKASGGAGTTCVSHSYRPLGTLVPLFAIGNYANLNNPAVEIHHLADHKSAADDYVLAVEQVAPFIERWFGDHRVSPDVKAEVVDLPDPGAAPFESGSMLLTPLTDDDTTMLLSALHQLTQVVFPSPRPWIFEGLPLFAQLSYLEREKGRTAAMAYLENHRNVFLQSETHRDGAQPDLGAQDSLINSPDEFYIEAKSMNVWWMLRDMVGEAALTAALHNYKAASDTRTDYLERLIEAQAHRDLSWFFNDWVYRDRGVPDFRIVSVYPRQLAVGGYLVTVTVENRGTAAAEVPVTLKSAATESSARLIVPPKSAASVRIEIPAMPLEAVVNDGSVPETDTSNHRYRIPPGSETQN
jgi:hypothetical protein